MHPITSPGDRAQASYYDDEGKNHLQYTFFTGWSFLIFWRHFLFHHRLDTIFSGGSVNAANSFDDNLDSKPAAKPSEKGKIIKSR